MYNLFVGSSMSVSDGRRHIVKNCFDLDKSLNFHVGCTHVKMIEWASLVAKGDTSFESWGKCD